MTNINDFDTSNIPDTPTEKVEVKTPDQISPPAQGELEVTALSDILGLSKEETSKYHDKIDTILEWAKGQTKDHSLENLKWTIRELGFKLGTPPLGQNQASWLAEYAFLNMESKKINSRLKEFENGR